MCPHAGLRGHGRWGHTSYWKSRCRDLGPRGFRHVHTCWCDSGVMARMGTTGSFLPPVPLSSLKLGDWDVDSGRKRLGAWNPDLRRLPGKPDSWVLKREEKLRPVLELEGGGGWGSYLLGPQSTKG